MKSKNKKRVLGSLIILFFILFFKLFFDYFEYSSEFNKNYKSKVVSFGEEPDTKVSYAILNDGTEVYLGNYFPPGFNPNKGDTLIKRSKSFYVKLKREGKITDSFMCVYANFWVSKCLIK